MANNVPASDIREALDKAFKNCREMRFRENEIRQDINMVTGEVTTERVGSEENPGKVLSRADLILLEIVGEEEYQKIAYDMQFMDKDTIHLQAENTKEFQGKEGVSQEEINEALREKLLRAKFGNEKVDDAIASVDAMAGA